jgi:hypothetical protein
MRVEFGFTGQKHESRASNLLSRGLKVNRMSLKSAQQQGRCDV